MPSHLLSRPRGALLTLFKCFQGKAQERVLELAAQLSLAPMQLAGARLWLHFSLWKICFVIPEKGQVFVTFLLGLPFSFSFFNQCKSFIFKKKKKKKTQLKPTQRNAILSLSCLSLPLLLLTVLPLFREVYVSTCLF